jgi:hypothetical protein
MEKNKIIIIKIFIKINKICYKNNINYNNIKNNKNMI